MTEDTLEFPWELAPAVQEGENTSVFGDYFEVGPRYLGQVKSLTKIMDKETGKVRVELEALCLAGGTAAGRTLKSTFWFPLRSELLGLSEADLKKKTYPARLFNAFVVACGHKEQTKDTPVPLGRLVGDQFEYTVKDYVMKGREKMLPTGEMRKYEDRTLSQLDMVYKVGSGLTADSTQVKAAPKTETAPDGFEDFK